MITQPIFSRRFVGRQRELHSLVEVARAVTNGPMRSVVITGEAGSGKSRLVREFQSHPDLKRVRFVRGACFDYAQPTYAPIEDILRSLDAAEPKVLDRDPDLRNAAALFFRDTEGGSPREAADYRKRKAFDAVVELLRRYSAIRPTVFIIEDLHWSDSATLEVLQHIGNTFSGTGAMFVVTSRHDEPDTKAKIDTFLAKFERQPLLSKLHLEGLDEAASLEMIESALPQSATVPPPQRRKIATAAGGNPLYVEELLKTIVDGGDLDAVPTNINLAIESRLAALSGSNLHILRIAAVLVHFSAEFLTEITHEPAEAVFGALRSALSLNLLRESGIVGRYAFRHEILRQAVLTSLLPDQERLMHRVVAEQLEKFPHADEYVAELALHWWQSGDLARSQKYNRLAGDRAFQKFAFGDAIVYYERALQGTEEDLAKAEILSQLARAYQYTNQTRRSISALVAAERTFSDIGRTDEQIEQLLELFRAYYRVLDFTEAAAALQRAVDVSGNNARESTKFHVHVWKTWYAAHRLRDVDATLASADEAKQFQDEADFNSHAALQEAVSYAYYLRGDIERWREASELAVYWAKKTKDPFSIIRHLTGFANDAETIDARLANQLFKEAVELAESLGLADAVPNTVVGLAYSQWYLGELESAADNCKEVLLKAEDFPWAQVTAAIVGIPVALELEDEGLLALAINPRFLEFCAQNPVMLGQLSRGHAEYEMANGETRSAMDRIVALVTALEKAKYNERLLLRVAQWNVAAVVSRAENLLIESAKGQKDGEAMLSLFRALNSKRDRVANATRAAELFRELGWRLDEALALEIMGQEQAALEIYLKCRARNSIARLRRSDEPSHQIDGLTPRELEIAKLVAEGKTNRAIAQLFVLSDRTVENHLTSIFAKLGLRSRTELAASWKTLQR